MSFAWLYFHYLTDLPTCDSRKSSASSTRPAHSLCEQTQRMNSLFLVLLPNKKCHIFLNWWTLDIHLVTQTSCTLLLCLWAGLHGTRFRLIQHVICIICLKHDWQNVWLSILSASPCFFLHAEMLLHAFYVTYKEFYLTIPAKVTALNVLYLLFRCFHI